MPVSQDGSGARHWGGEEARGKGEAAVCSGCGGQRSGQPQAGPVTAGLCPWGCFGRGPYGAPCWPRSLCLLVTSLWPAPGLPSREVTRGLLRPTIKKQTNAELWVWGVGVQPRWIRHWPCSLCFCLSQPVGEASRRPKGALHPMSAAGSGPHPSTERGVCSDGDQSPRRQPRKLMHL